jgi:alkylhydroperoxidase family enzyme
MEITEARVRTLEAVRDAQIQEQIAEQAMRIARGMWKIAAGYTEMFPELADEIESQTGITVIGRDEGDGAETRPRGADAVARIMQDRPGEQFAVSELVKRLRDRGWLPESENPANAVRTALERLCSDGASDVRKHRYRTVGGSYSVSYSYDPDTETEPQSYSDYGEEPF